MIVGWTATAIRQLDAIHDYISRDSTVYARRMVDRLTSRTVQLQEHPFSGAVVPEFGDESIREVFEGPYRIVYRKVSSTLYVVAVIHGARLLTGETLDEPK